MSLHHGWLAPARAQLVATGVHVERGGRPVLTDLTLAVNRGTRLGVVGENGRGKSTLLQVLSGALPPDRGEVVRIGSLGVAEQEIAVDAQRTVGGLIDVELAQVRAALRAVEQTSAALAAGRPGADDAYTQALELAVALDAWAADRHVNVALSALGAVTDRTRPLAELSVGQRYRVRVACLLAAWHDFLLLDEPTNHLDIHGLEYLTEALRASSAGIVLVSHDRRLLADVATKVLDLDPSSDGRPRLYGDGYAGYVAGRQAELARWTQAHDRYLAEQQRLVDDLSAAQNRLRSGWRPPKGTGKHQRATRAASTVRAVHRRREDLAAHEVTKPQAPLRFELPDLPAVPGTTLIQANEVRVEGRLPVPVTLILGSGDRLLITGPNGAGKSTLLSILSGELPPDHGTVMTAPTARIGIVAQESRSGDRRTAREVFDERFRPLHANDRDHDPISLSALGLLSSSDQTRPVAELSMGQQRRLDLAHALAARPHALLLDEPTNHLSIALVDELIQALDATPAAVIIVSHDRQMRDDLAHWPTLRLPGHPS